MAVSEGWPKGETVSSVVATDKGEARVPVNNPSPMLMKFIRSQKMLENKKALPGERKECGGRSGTGEDNGGEYDQNIYKYGNVLMKPIIVYN